MANRKRTYGRHMSGRPIRRPGILPQARQQSREWLPLANGRKRAVLPTGE